MKRHRGELNIFDIYTIILCIAGILMLLLLDCGG